MKGKIAPGNKGVKVKLQRKTARGWDSIGTAKTKKNGKFTVSARAGSTGKWTVRVVVSAGKGNLGTATKTATVKVSRKPSPAPSKASVDTQRGSQESDSPPAPDRSPAERTEKVRAPSATQHSVTATPAVACAGTCPAGAKGPRD